MIRTTIIVGLVSVLSILGKALSELGKNSDEWKGHSSNRLVFAHFMVRVKGFSDVRTKTKVSNERCTRLELPVIDIPPLTMMMT
jgi:hypothetical protein